MAPAVAGSNPVIHPNFHQVPGQFPVFIDELEKRHLANLRFSEVTKALRALSSAYVERRETALAANRALDGAGTRAAFALYYGPLHFLLIEHIVRELGLAVAPGTIVDLGCGTGVGGAAVAASTSARVSVLGIDTHPWNIDEARETYRAFGVRADVRRGNAAHARFPTDTSFVIAAFFVNELNDAARTPLLEQLLQVATAPRHVLVVEPISQRISPWWDQWADAFITAGGRADTWKARVDMPPIVTRLAKASGLRPELLTARSLFL